VKGNTEKQQIEKRIYGKDNRIAGVKEGWYKASVEP